MALVIFHTRRVRQALREPINLGVDLLLLLTLAGIIGAIFAFARQVTAPYQRTVEISLSFWALPKYTLFSLSRGIAAYVLSLVFTLIYGTVAAHNHRAEKVMVPALDVLQSIPVLSFLPTLVLAMIALFPTRQIGLELAAIIMIFTGQVWNMTFSYYGSLRSIPSPLREASQVYPMSRWRIFRVLELPASMIGLVWNSMMSMAGGWFFLTVNEAFRLGDDDYRLPGIGSYMSVAIDQFDPHLWATWRPILGAIVAMIVMIVAVDQLFWRPVVAWSERFKLEETAATDKPQSWVLSLFKRSFVFKWLSDLQKRRARAKLENFLPPNDSTSPVASTSMRSRGKAFLPQSALVVLRWAFLIALFVAALAGLRQLAHLLTALPWRDPARIGDWRRVLGALGASGLRTTSAVLIGAAWTLPVGILIGLSPRWSQRLQPVIQVVASFPAPMLFPLVTLALVFLHIRFTAGCVTLMLLGTQWYILFNVIAGAMAIPSDLKEVSSVFGSSRWRLWTRLYVPSVFPYLVTGLITAAGGAWNATIVSEYVKVKDDVFDAFGLGSLISKATDNKDFPLLAAATVSMAVAVVTLNRLLWKRLYRLAESRYSLNT